MSSYKWLFFTLIALFFPASSFITAKQNASKTITVDPSGRGDFKTIQSAVDSVPSDNRRWTIINIKAGLYREQVKIIREKPYIYLRGEGMNHTFITWNYVDAEATFNSEANNTLAKGITFINSHNHKKRAMARGVAAWIKGDKSAFYGCGFMSLQDTLWDDSGRHYFQDCTIHGTIDFIYGAGQSIYENSTISVAENGKLAGYITAQGRGAPEETSGFVFKNCRIVGNGAAYLGRPWRPYATVVFYNTEMDDVVVPEGWYPWESKGKEDKLTMAEYNCSGPGARSKERVEWAKSLSEREVKEFTSMAFIDNGGSWLNQTLTLLGV